MSEHLILTLGQILAHRPCVRSARQFLPALGYDLPYLDPADDLTIATFDGRFDPTRRVSLGDIAYSNGAADALWCTRCLPDTLEVRRVVVGMILPAVKRAAKRTTDARVHGCIADVGHWQAGDDSVDLGAATRATEATWAAWAAWAAREAAARGEWVWVSGAAVAAARAAEAGFEEERERQRADIIAASPLLAFADNRSAA